MIGKGNTIAKSATGLFCVLLLAIGGIITVRIFRWYWPYHDQALAEATTIGPEWLEITPQSPLHAERQRQMIALDLERSTVHESDRLDLVLPDGSVVQPELQLIGADGKIYDLNVPSFFLGDDGTLLAYFSGLDLPKNVAFSKVRIRASQSLPCKRIFWRDYNSWEAESPF